MPEHFFLHIVHPIVLSINCYFTVPGKELKSWKLKISTKLPNTIAFSLFSDTCWFHTLCFVSNSECLCWAFIFQPCQNSICDKKRIDFNHTCYCVCQTMSLPLFLACLWSGIALSGKVSCIVLDKCFESFQNQRPNVIDPNLKGGTVSHGPP
jgi:hypothetical protein